MGDEVYFCNSGIGVVLGNYVELVVVDERFVENKLSFLSFVEVVVVFLVLIIVWEFLYDWGKL